MKFVHRLTLFLSAFLMTTVFAGIAFAAGGSFADGDGSGGDPYQIEDCLDLQAMNNDLTASYILINDIDCSATSGWNGGEGFR